MKYSFYFAAIMIACCSLRALDPGGVSVDFAQIQPDSSKAQGGNLIEQGGFEEPDINVANYKDLAKYKWGGHFYVHSAEQAENDLLPQLSALAIRRIVTANPASGKQCVMLESPMSMQKLQNEQGRPQMSNRIALWVKVPLADNPVKYRVSMKLRGKIEAVPGNNTFIGFAECKDNQLPGKAKSLAPATQQILTVPASWEERSFEFIAPPQTVLVTLSLALYGIGQIYLDDVQMVPVESASGITGKLFPASMMDKLFALAPGQPGSLSFVVKNEPGTSIGQLLLQLTLPQGFKIIDTLRQMPVISATGNADGSTTTLIDISTMKSGIQKDRYYTWAPASALVDTSLQPGETLYPASYRFLDGDYQSPLETFQLKVMEPVQASSPKRFRSGGMFAYEWDYTGAGVKPLSDFYRNAGFNSVHGGGFIPLNVSLKQLGIERYLETSLSCDGYQLGPTGKPDYALFRLADGTPYIRSSRIQDICPVEVYREGEYFKHVLVPMYEKLLVKDDITDHIMSNWEPYMFDFKGCFCDRCRDEFFQFTADKLDPEKVKARWPKEIIAYYRADWIKFRSHQHALLVETLEKIINRIGKEADKDSHFIPEVAWDSMIEGDHSNYAQYDVADYMGKLPWLEPWGPYIFHQPSQPYEYFPGAHLATYLVGRDVQEFLTANLKSGVRRPKLIAFPQGIQGEDWFTEPEAISFEFLCFFLNGWDGAFGYRFPRGYDHRYWLAIGQANRDIADFETYIYDGKNISEKAKVIPETPLPKPILPGKYKHKIKGLESAAILQWNAFENQGKYLIAIGNFWLKGEAFFSVGLSGLNPSALYAVHLNREYLGEFSGSQLKSGILAHAGALRWSFLTVEPRREVDYGKAFSQEQMRAEMTRRSPVIQKSMQWELDYAAALQTATERETRRNDFSLIQPIDNAGISQKAIKEDSRNYLEIKTPQYRALIDPATGGRIAECQAGNIPLVCKDDKLGMAVDAFWWPEQAAIQVTSGYKIIDLRAAGNGITVTLERIIDRRDNNYLAELKITKKYFCSTREITVNTRIDNPTDRTIDFSFRYHNLPAFLSTRDGKSGIATFGDGQSFTRDLIFKIYRFAAPDPELEKTFSMDKSFKTASQKVVFSAPWTPRKISAEVPADLLQSFVFWDSGKQTCSTFEPIFKKYSLLPGKSVNYEIKWTIH